MSSQNKIYWVVIDGILSDGVDAVRRDAEKYHIWAFVYNYAWHRVFAGFATPTKAMEFREFVRLNYVYASLAVGQSLYPFLHMQEAATFMPGFKSDK